MGAYDFNFDLSADETFVPNPDQVRALQALMPKEPFALAPKANDRAAWGRWQQDPFGQRVLANARELAAQPFPDYNNTTWLASLEQQSVTQINAALGLARKRQAVFLLAEAIHDAGEFLGVIESDAHAISKVNTWTHPGNDLKRLNYDLKTMEPDLVTVHFTETLALTDYILEDRLPVSLRTLIRDETHRRVFAPMRQRIETGRDLYWWIIVKHNWSSVCLFCVAHAAVALLPGAADRAWWLAFAQNNVFNFRDSFTDDGFCTEGVSYWGYGFGHYIFMSELLRVATGNTIDLLTEPKMARAARFPLRTEIQPGVYPAFADCGIDACPPLWARLWPDNRVGTTQLPVAPVAAGLDPLADLGTGTEALIWMFRTRDPRKSVQLSTPPELRNWFEQSSLLICRPAPATTSRFSATLLGGNNGVNHNHNDLGTFTVVLDGRTLVLDPGLETYSYRTFSEKRYDSQLLNSYGHPVPRVAGRLQEAGPEWRTRVLSKEFTADTDRMVLDLRGAYDVPGLRKLQREFLYDRRGAGSLTITDRVEFVEPAAFESALITLGKVTVEGARIRLDDGKAAITAEVTVEGATLDVSTDTITQPPHPTRIALRCAGDVRAAVIRTVFRPV
jgi:hypothetical protein